MFLLGKDCMVKTIYRVCICPGVKLTYIGFYPSNLTLTTLNYRNFCFKWVLGIVALFKYKCQIDQIVAWSWQQRSYIGKMEKKRTGKNNQL